MTPPLRWVLFLSATIGQIIFYNPRSDFGCHSQSKRANRDIRQCLFVLLPSGNPLVSNAYVTVVSGPDLQVMTVAGSVRLGTGMCLVVGTCLFPIDISSDTDDDRGDTTSPNHMTVSELFRHGAPPNY